MHNIEIIPTQSSICLSWTRDNRKLKNQLAKINNPTPNTPNKCQLILNQTKNNLKTQRELQHSINHNLNQSHNNLRKKPKEMFHLLLLLHSASRMYSQYLLNKSKKIYRLHHHQESGAPINSKRMKKKKKSMLQYISNLPLMLIEEIYLLHLLPNMSSNTFKDLNLMNSQTDSQTDKFLFHRQRKMCHLLHPVIRWLMPGHSRNQLLQFGQSTILTPNHNQNCHHLHQVAGNNPMRIIIHHMSK